MAVPDWRVSVLPFVVALPAWAGEESPLPEYQVKAMYLARIPAYVEWPSLPPGSAVPDGFHIGVLGRSPFGEDLARLMDVRTVRGVPIKVKQAWRVEELLHCQVIFICASKADELEEILARVRGLPILIVSDAPEGVFYGAMVTFSLDHKRVILEVNLSAAKASRLSFSSFLLKNAKVLK